MKDVSYFEWITRQTRRDPRRRDEADREEPAKPSEPLEVEEHHADTTIVERIRDALRSRFRSP